MAIAMSSKVFCALACLCAQASAQHAYYSFKTDKTNFDNFTSYLRWTGAEKGDVYLATQFYTGCAGGYFGGQLHSDGTHSILFSIWDFNATWKKTQGVSPWCARFGGEGEGAHCGLDFVFEFNVEYRFALTKSSNASGALFSTTVTKVSEEGAEVPTFLGTIFVEGPADKDCTTLAASGISFQEYYLGGDFYSAAAWRGPYMDHDGHSVEGVAAFDADADCGNATAPSNVSSTPPLGSSGKPVAFYQQGGSTEHGCEKSMWQHASELGSIKELPFHRRPTAIGATKPTSAVEYV